MKTGYEISFTRYFYKPPLRTLEEIRADILALERETDGLLEEISGALDAVESLDQDRILRSFLGTITATLRTSYFQVGPSRATGPNRRCTPSTRGL